MTRTGRRTWWALGASALVATTTLGVWGGDPGAAALRSAGRVDTRTPTFSHPTRITNPLFPITATTQMISLGTEGDVALRQETTLLDRTRTIRWKGKDVRVVESQFVAFADGRIAETAIDFFAQADDGAVWYFGEEVTNYEDGKVKDHDGTWLAGRDGPPGMIMPARPKVGDVYRPENIPGVVFEETTVKAVGLTVDGPSGPIRGAIRVEEHPEGGDVETKIYAPGYGEFEAIVPASDEHVTAALAIPTDERRGQEPSSLDVLSDKARDLLRHADHAPWARLRTDVRAARSAWDRFGATGPSAALAAEMEAAVGEMERAVASRDRPALAQAGLDAEFAGLDLELPYTDHDEVDHDRIESWRSQRALDEAARDSAGVASDRVIIAAIKERLRR